MLLPALALLGGVAATLMLVELPGWPLLAGLALLGVLALGLRCHWLAWALAGCVLAGAQGQRLLATDWPCSRDRERVAVGGVVVSPPEPREDRVDFDFRPDVAARADGVPPRLRLSWYAPQAVPRPGESWHFDVRLRCRSGLANPGGYDRELALLREGYGATGYATGPAPRTGRDVAAAPIEAARAWVAERIAGAAGHTRSVGVLQGLAVGLRGSIPAELRDAFAATGTAHLIAISGMHVTAFAMVVLWLSRRVRRACGGPALSAHWPGLQSALVVAVTAGYGLLAGASLPTVRTVAMVAIAACMRIARRDAGIDRLLAVAATALVAADPLAMTSAGFWLSFASVAALVSIAPAPHGALPSLRAFVRSQAAVTVILVPVLAAAFGSVSVVAPLANAVAIPLFSFAILPVTLAATVLLPAWPALADGLWSLLGGALDRCWPALLAIAARPGASFSPPEPPAWLLAAALVCAALALLVPGRSARLLAVCAIGALVLRASPGPERGEFELSVLDVGHGLAAVVRTASHVLVFDTGPDWRGGGDAARVTLVPFLRAAGLRSIDLVIVSHGDSDHAGGLASLRRALRVGRVIGDPAEPGSHCLAGRAWSWDEVRFEVLHPPAGEAPAGNDGSCALRVVARSGTALLLADPGRRAEQLMLAQELQADTVIVPHHGSASSSTPGLIAAVGARVALVSNGFGNRWGLPRPEVVARWRAAGARVYTTADGGALTVRSAAGNGSPAVVAHRHATGRWWRRRG